MQLTVGAKYSIVGRAFSNAAAAASYSRWNWVLAHMCFQNTFNVICVNLKYFRTVYQDSDWEDRELGYILIIGLLDLHSAFPPKLWEGNTVHFALKNQPVLFNQVTLTKW